MNHSQIETDYVIDITIQYKIIAIYLPRALDRT